MPFSLSAGKTTMLRSSSLIITSIASPNAALKAFAHGCLLNNIELIIIGDQKSPKEFALEGSRFISVQQQQSLNFKLAALLPFNHYSRKNLGYLLAKDKQVIIETDDDNFPKENFWKNNTEFKATPQLITQKGWINIYSYFSKDLIWPRGLPLEEVSNDKIQMTSELPQTSAHPSSSFQIIQGLADENPDVDAVYRLTYSLPKYFDAEKSFALGNGSWCPFNSQNTTWMKPAFPLLYLPSYCSFRMTDIWRSFIAQRISWEYGWMVLFQSPTVVQQRNEHNLIKDFEDEIPGYIHNNHIKEALEDLNLKAGEKNILDNLVKCYEVMIKNKWIAKEEMALVEAWCEDILC